MEGGLVGEFINQTGSDPETAYMYLQTYNWDLKISLETWYQNQSAKTTDKSEVRKLARGISRATDNENLVLKARDAIAKDFENNRLCKMNNYHVETPETTFLLPDLGMYGEEFRIFLEKDLIEKSVMTSLEVSMKLNWWCTDLGPANKLWSLSTTGDGNCLLHAASLATYGFHDRMLTLRQALHRFITGSQAMIAIRRRWRWQQTKANMLSGVQYSEVEWDKEWNTVVDIASAKKRKSNQQGIYESLEEIHILVLAHVLQRAIIVISETVLKDSYNEPLAPIHFGGIYVPFECDYRNCHRSPILLTYDMAHFSALVFMEKEGDDNTTPFIFFVPVTNCEGEMLPIQFSVDPGEGYNWNDYAITLLHAGESNEKEQLNILKPYLDIIDIFGTGTGPEIESEDEIDRLCYISYNEGLLEEDAIDIFCNRNRAARQLQVFGKQMGSIGKSMSKKLRKNFGSLTKLAAKPKKKEESKEKLLCAEVHIKRHAYQNEMINNYLKFAGEKFIREHILSQIHDKTLEEKEQALQEGLVKCINTSCDSLATCLTSYMCSKCYDAQKKEELSKMNESYFGIGKSKFYGEPDQASYSAVKHIPSSTLLKDRSLYLSNSTFYNDTGNNNNTITDLNDNVSALMVNENRKAITIPNVTVTFTNDRAVKQYPPAKKALPVKKLPVEKLISEFDFGQIPIPEASRKLLSSEPLVPSINVTDSGSARTNPMPMFKVDECLNYLRNHGPTPPPPNSPEHDQQCGYRESSNAEP